MARVPRVIPNQPLSAFSQGNVPRVNGFTALGEVLQYANQKLQPALKAGFREKGAQSVYRDETGTLRVDEMSLLGGEMAVEHNAAAYSAYLGQQRVDLRNSVSELAMRYEFDPAGFKEAAGAYKSRAMESVPPLLASDVSASIDAETSAVANRLTIARVNRDREASDRTTKVARDLAFEDARAAFGTPEFDQKMAEAVSIQNFRVQAPYIGDTAADTEKLVRETMAGGKTDALKREIIDLQGKSSITPEKRASLEAAINDADLPPETRVQLYGLLDGSLKDIDAAGIVQDATSGDFWGRLDFVESGNNPNAIPTDPKTGKALSSASGTKGITDGTFVGAAKSLASKGQADWAKGKSDKEILAMKSDPVAYEAAAREIRAQNQTALTNAGVPINPGNEYLAWFLGPGDAVKVLTSASNDPIKGLISDASIKANAPIIRGFADWTVGDIRNWSARKMRPSSSDIGAINQRIAQIPDTEVRAKAASKAQQWYGLQRQAEGEVAESYKLRITAGDSVSSEEIINDVRLDDGSQAELLRSLGSRNSEVLGVQDTLANLNNPEYAFDVTDVKERNSVNKAYKAQIGNVDPISPQAVPTGYAVTKRIGYAPKALASAVQGAVASGDPARLSEAMAFAETITQDVPNAFSLYSKDINTAISEYRHHVRMGRTPEEAGSLMVAARDPAAVEKRAGMSKEADRIAGTLTKQDLLDSFDHSYFSDPTLVPNEQATDLMMAMFRQETKDAYFKTGDAETARSVAKDQMGRIFGVSSLTGGERLMRLPPESFPMFYPPINGSHDWLSNQLVADVNRQEFGDFSNASASSGFFGMFGGDGGVPKEDIYLVGDDQTQKDFNAGIAPSYQVFYQRDGKIEQLQGRWFGDPKGAMNERAAIAEKGISRAQAQQQDKAIYREFQDLRNKVGFEQAYATIDKKHPGWFDTYSGWYDAPSQ